MAPFDLTSLAGTLPYFLIFFGLGAGFGAALELGGFGDTRKLAAQFYLTDMTVLKTMFTGIVVAMLLLFGASTLGLLDMSRVWVNPTYLPSEILGGLIMGVGFVVGGFCPGTSLVAAATLKVDGMVFVLGGLTGVWLFGESVAGFEPFWLSGNHGRFTLPDWLGLPTGVVVLLVVLMAILMFWGAEWLESRFGGEVGKAAASSGGRLKLAGAGALIVVALALVARGQPTPEQRWAWASPAVHELAEQGGMLVHPAEVVALAQDTNLAVQVLDLRSEHDFNLFHVGGSRRVEPAELERPDELRRLLEQPASSVTFLIGNGDATAIAAWKRLRAQGVPNLYAIEGGVNRWLELYPPPACVAAPAHALDPAPPVGPADAAADSLAWTFAFATGGRLPSSSPQLRNSHEFLLPCEDGDASHAGGAHGHRWPEHAFSKKVKLQLRTVVKGGCG